MKTSYLLAAMGGVAIAGAAALIQAPPAQAQSVKCGEIYTVKRGETLSLIATRAYGDNSRAMAIYRENAGVIGGNPSLIEVGMKLKIPCVEGAAATAAAATATTGTTTPTEPKKPDVSRAVPPTPDDTIRILTAGDWAPFLDEDHPKGGMFIEIVNLAMRRAGGRPEYKIDFINDWGAHLQPLLSDHAYDLGVAWFRPNCALMDKLGEGATFRCDNLNWSEPIFEQVVGYYTRRDYPVPTDHEELFGSKLCRPEGYSVFMLEEEDLVAPNIELIQPDGPEEAFQMLLDGECDVVVLSVDVSDGVIAKLDAADKVRQQDRLNQIARLAVVISKTHPRGEEILAKFDEGLKRIKEDGTWFRVVQRHMNEHKARTATN